jgi:hypothetical protein
MPRNFSARFALFATCSVGIAVAAALAAASTGNAAPRQVALVEDVIGSSTVEVMDYVDAGQTIRLGAHDSIVLSYLHSCIRETVTGGTITIGIEQSEVQGGRVTRRTLACNDHTFVLTGGNETQFAGRVFRGLTPDPANALAGGQDNGRLRSPAR